MFCPIIILGLCVNPTGLQDIKSEWFAVHEAVYSDYTIRFVTKDAINTLNPEQTSKVCRDDICVSYHQFCGQRNLNAYCTYEIQRSNRQESLTITAYAHAGVLDSKWRHNVHIILDFAPVSVNSAVQLDELSKISASADAPILGRPR